MNIDEIFESWADKINELQTVTQNYIAAELNYESILAKALIKIKENHGMSLAKDIARGEPEVMAAKKNLLECKRLVDAGKAKIVWLEAQHNYLKLKIRVENKISMS